MKISFDYDLIIVGGGPSGLTAAVMSSEMGIKTLLIEKDKIGGDCTHYGCVPSKTLIHSGKIARRFLDFSKYGLRIKNFNKRLLEKAEFDFNFAIENVQEKIDKIYYKESPTNLSKKFNFDIELGEAKFQDKNSIEVNGAVLTSKKFIISTGSRAKIPNIEGLKASSFLTNKDIFKKRNFKSITIIGGGFIGCEIGEALNNLGIKVNIVHSRSTLLDKIDEEISTKITTKFLKEGIKLFLNKRFCGIIEKDNRKFIKIVDKDNGEISKIVSDEVLIAIGRTPNTQNMGFENIGIDYDENGIKVNKYLQTNIKNIYACGDVINKENYTHFSNYSAKICVLNAIFKNFFKCQTFSIPKCVYIESDISQVGFTKKELKEKKIKYTKLRKELTDIDKSITTSNTLGFLEIYVDKKGYILGALFFGENTSELIGEISFLIKNKLKITKLSDTVHPYPTISYGLRNLCDEYRAKNLTQGKKKLIKLFFNLFN